jgi:hypothetical protein
MKATVFSHENIIGTTDLIIGDRSMGHVYGTLIPNQFYFDHIQKHVWDFWKTSKPDYDKWYSLRFNVQLENGYFLFPAGGYTLDDLPIFPNEPKRIDIAGIDSHIFEDFFEIPLKDFVLYPWEAISISQKIAFEDELSKEIGLTTVDRSIFRFLPRKKEHASTISLSYSVLCTDSRNDDVLFAVNRRDINEGYVVIHLTWTGKQEFNDYPIKKYY